MSVNNDWKREYGMKPLKETRRKELPPSGGRLSMGIVTAAGLLALTAKPAAAAVKATHIFFRFDIDIARGTRQPGAPCVD